MSKLLFESDDCRYYDDFTWTTVATPSSVNIWQIQNGLVYFNFPKFLHDNITAVGTWKRDILVVQKAYQEYLMRLITDE